MNPLDPSTWFTSVLFTPEGPIRYWVFCDLEEYFEQYATDNSLTKVQIAVAWNDAIAFKWYALGFAERAGTGSGITYLQRYTPLLCPIQDSDAPQYLVDLKKRKVLPGIQADGLTPAKVGTPLYASYDFFNNNWFTLPEPSRDAAGEYVGMPPRIVYDATFTMLPYEVVDQETLVASGDTREQKRFIIPTEKSSPRERKTPSFGFERDDTGTPIPEVGFIPYFDETHTVTWVGVPWALVPRTAMRQCYLTINNAAFGYKNSGVYGRWNAGTVRFDGLAREITPYRNAAGQRVVDLPYVFTHQPGDPTVGGGDTNTHWKVPIGQSWVLIRRRGSAGADIDRLYAKANFETLFQPEPP